MPAVSELRLEVGTVYRSKGASLMAKLAYQTGLAIEDEKQNKTWDYSRKEGVVDTFMAIPGGYSGENAAEMVDVWKRIDHHHKRGDAQPARFGDFDLPKELTYEQQTEISKDFAKEFADRYGVVCQVTIHEGRNGLRHAHWLASSCSALVVDEALTLGKKVNELDAIHCQRNALPNLAEVLRPWWAEYQNAVLSEHGIDKRIEHRSFAARELDIIPTIHVGYGPYADVRREVNEQIRITNSGKAFDDREAARIVAEAARAAEAARIAAEAARAARAAEAARVAAEPFIPTAIAAKAAEAGRKAAEEEDAAVAALTARMDRMHAWVARARSDPKQYLSGAYKYNDALHEHFRPAVQAEKPGRNVLDQDVTSWLQKHHPWVVEARSALTAIAREVGERWDKIKQVLLPAPRQRNDRDNPRGGHDPREGGR
jgi:hypothetical protein